MIPNHSNNTIDIYEIYEIRWNTMIWNIMGCNERQWDAMKCNGKLHRNQEIQETAQKIKKSMSCTRSWGLKKEEKLPRNRGNQENQENQRKIQEKLCTNQENQENQE